MHKPKGFTAIDARFSAIEGNIVDILRRVSNLQRNWEKEIHGERERERERERREWVDEGLGAWSDCGSELPFFQNKDAFPWVDKAKRFFQVKGISKEDWLSAAMVATEGRVVTWYQWW